LHHIVHGNRIDVFDAFIGKFHKKPEGEECHQQCPDNDIRNNDFQKHGFSVQIGPDPRQFTEDSHDTAHNRGTPCMVKKLCFGMKVNGQNPDKAIL
jgi:hypothetical protein